METKKKEQGEEKNSVMKAINSMKEALSQIEKEYTMQETNMEDEQDGNIGATEDGEQDYEKTSYDAKKKMLINKLMKG